MEFVIYTGHQKTITIGGVGLSKTYRLTKDIPTPIAADGDRLRLLGYVESSQKTCCGGRRKITRPVSLDVNYCKLKRLNLEQFRNEWEEYWTQSD